MATRVRVSVGKTINLDNYESLRVDVAVEREIPAGTDYRATAIQLGLQCGALVNQEGERLVKDHIERYR